jgi:hypothetical protein
MGYLQVESFLKIETGKESKLIFRLKRIRLEKFNMLGVERKGHFAGIREAKCRVRKTKNSDTTGREDAVCLKSALAGIQYVLLPNSRTSTWI